MFVIIYSHLLLERFSPTTLPTAISQIFADCPPIISVKSFGTIVFTISGNVPTNFELQRLKGTLLLKLGEMAAYKR